MSSEDKYFTLPLAILRSSSSALDALHQACSYGTVGAGIGYRELSPTREDGECYDTLLSEAMKHRMAEGEPILPPKGVESDLWEAALAGAELLDIEGGDPADDVKVYQENHRPGEVFFRIRADWLWNAIYQARREAGIRDSHGGKPLSWLEFRILAALLSGKVNKYDFTFQSWETIQARACGFHSKELFQAGKDALPAHCQPLSRDVIRRRLDRLEVLGFFARCRYSTGSRGGLTAYSFRHPNRRKLIEDVLEWRENNINLQEKARGLRYQDLDVFRSQLKPAPQSTKGSARPGKASRPAAQRAVGSKAVPPPPAGLPAPATPARPVPGPAIARGPEPSFLTRTRGPQSKTTSVGDALAQLFADNQAG